MADHQEPTSEAVQQKLDGVATTTGERRKDHPRRKRASKACLACRRRKVRCDVAQRGAPCMNCFLDNDECVVKPRLTKYRVHKRESISEAVPQRPRASSNTSSANSDGQFENSAIVQTLSPMQDILKGSDKNHDTIEETRNQDHIKRPIIEKRERRKSRANDAMADLRRESTGPLVQQSAISPSAESMHSQRSVSMANTHIMFSYYPFLNPGSISQIPAEDVNFLEGQGCFRIPRRPMLDEYVREYFLHIQPILPLLNEATFWQMYETTSANSANTTQMSLFVFQAMLFATSSFVQNSTAHKLGFENCWAARTAFHRRARLLFEFDGESSQLAMAQGTLLMSYFSPMRNQPKANKYWLGISINMAKQSDAHRYATKTHITPEQRNQLKRLWWCCILRDRILPLGVRKSIQIFSSDFDFRTQSPLLLEDFEGEFENSRVYDSTTKRALSQRLVALCELAVALTDVILVLYPEREPFLPGADKDQAAVVRACKFDLNTWYEKTTVKCLTSPAIGGAHESVLLYTNLMYIYYHSAMLALCNHEVMLITIGAQSSGTPSNNFAQIYNSRRRIEEAINGISDNLKELVQLKLAKYMPISVVAYAALPLVLHLLDVKLSSTPFRTAKKQRRLAIYTEAMRALQSQYDVTDAVSEIIGKLVAHISLENADGLVETPSNHSDVVLGSLGSRFSDDPSALNDWGDVLLRQPKLYLRLALTMDLSMSKGQFPKDSDFPQILQSKPTPESYFPTYQIAMNDAKAPGYTGEEILHGRIIGSGSGSGSGNNNNNNTESSPPSHQQDETGSAVMTSQSRFDRPLAFTPNGVMTPNILDRMNFDASGLGLELPMGFEAFDMELSSKRGFNFDFQWNGDTGSFQDPM